MNAHALSLCGKADGMHQPHSSPSNQGPRNDQTEYLELQQEKGEGAWECSVCHTCLTCVSFSTLVYEYLEGKESLPYSSLSLLPRKGLGTKQVSQVLDAF